MWGKLEQASADSGGNDGRSFAEQLNLKLIQSPWLGFFAFIGSLTLIAFLIIWLRPVIMPLVMAIFLSYIVRPLAESIASFDCMSCCCFNGRRQRDRDRHNGSFDSLSAEEQSLLKGTRGHDEEAAVVAHADEPWTIPRPFGVLLAMVVAAAIVVSLLAAAAYSITSFEAHSARYQSRAEHIWKELMMWLSGLTGIDLSDEYNNFPETASAAVAAAAMPVFMTVIQVIANALLILVFLIFVLLSPPSPKTSLRRRVDEMLTEYIVLKVTLATGIALAVFLVFCLLDVPMRVFFACHGRVVLRPEHRPIDSNAVAGPDPDPRGFPVGEVDCYHPRSGRYTRGRRKFCRAFDFQRTIYVDTGASPHLFGDMDAPVGGCGRASRNPVDLCRADRLRVPRRVLARLAVR